MAVAMARIARRVIWLSHRNVPYETLASGIPVAWLRATTQTTRAPYWTMAATPAATHIRTSCRRQVKARAMR